MGVEKLDHLAEAGPAHVLQRAPDAVLVGPLSKRGRVQRLRDCPDVRLVVIPQPQLLLHDLLLIFHLLGGDDQRAHSIRFHPKPQFNLVARQERVVVRVIPFGEGVVHAAVGLDQARKQAARDVFRTLEHEMLEQMRETGAALLFMPGADAVGDRDGDDGNGMLL